MPCGCFRLCNSTDQLKGEKRYAVGDGLDEAVGASRLRDVSGSGLCLLADGDG
jgi:hypothetical protein